MHDKLKQALEPVLHDLRETGAPYPVIDDHEWDDNPRYASARLIGGTGGGSGVNIGIEDSELERVLRATDQTQDWVLDELWKSGAATNWPPCPRRPGRHPLWCQPVDDVAMWVCTTDAVAIAPVGSLR